MTPLQTLTILIFTACLLAPVVANRRHSERQKRQWQREVQPRIEAFVANRDAQFWQPRRRKGKNGGHSGYIWSE